MLLYITIQYIFWKVQFKLRWYGVLKDNVSVSMTEIQRKIILACEEISEVIEERADSDDGTFDFNESFDQLTANKSTTQRANIEVLQYLDDKRKTLKIC